MEKLSELLPGIEKKKLTKIETAVKEYFEQTQKKNAAEKIAKKRRVEIIDHYKPGDKESLKSIGIEVNYSISTKEGIDKKLLLAKVKELGLTDCIKTVEEVDEDALTLKILDGEVNPKVLVECTTQTESSRLLIKRIK